jgi:septal ring factor EnvC (AmiA/AmiB activator)
MRNAVWGLLFVIISVPVAFATTQSKSRDRTGTLQVLAKDIEVAKNTLEIEEYKQKRVLTGLYTMNKNLQSLVMKRSELEQQKGLTEIQIQDLSEKMDQNTQQVQAQKSQLAERLRAIYKLQGPTLARFLFAAKNSADLERNLKILGIVAQRDLQMIQSFRQSLKDLEYRKAGLTQKLASLQDVEAALKQHEEKLQSEVSQKSKILAGIRRKKLFTENQIKNLKTKTLDYDLADSGIMDMLLKPSFEAQKGQLPKPIQGRVSTSFGLVKASNHSYVLSNKGLLIASTVGTPVKAVFDGVVSFAGSLPGLGKVLILDHGDHYYTVYGYNSEVRVQLGQEVSQAQVIAKSGRSSFDQQSGLYFEVRHFSEPYNPTEWVKGFSL